MRWIDITVYAVSAYIVFTHVSPSEQVLVAGCFMVSNLTTFVRGLIDA
jgi:hypothetical protein